MAAEAAIDLKFSQCFGEKGAVDDLTDGESSVREKEWKRIRRNAGGGLARTVMSEQARRHARRQSRRPTQYLDAQLVLTKTPATPSRHSVGGKV